jgi:CRP-like cAMP-binding protein
VPIFLCLPPAPRHQLDNLLLARPGDLSSARLVDFGLAAASFEADEADEAGMRWLCGSAAYMAPEIYGGAVPYSCAVDMWSAGVVLHLLLTGLTPFAGGEDDEATLKAAAQRKFSVSYDGPEWAGVSAPARQLVGALLTVAPGARATAAGALMHEWTAAAGADADADNASSAAAGGSRKGGGKASAASSAAPQPALAGTLAQLRRYAAAVQLPVVSFAAGEMLSASGERLGDSVFLIRKGTVEVLVPEARSGGEEGANGHTDSGNANGHGGAGERRAKSRGSGSAPRFRLVATRSAGDLVGDMGVTIDDAGRASMVVGPASGPAFASSGNLATSVSVASSLGYDSESSTHGGGHGGGGGGGAGPPPEGTAVDEWASVMLEKRYARRRAGHTRAATLRAATPVEAVRLARQQLAWAMDHDEVRPSCDALCAMRLCDALLCASCADLIVCVCFCAYRLRSRRAAHRGGGDGVRGGAAGEQHARQRRGAGGAGGGFGVTRRGSLARRRRTHTRARARTDTDARVARPFNHGARVVPRKRWPSDRNGTKERKGKGTV